MNYIAYTFSIQSKDLLMQTAIEILIAELGAVGFESFTETDAGVIAYIQEKDWHENILNEENRNKESQLLVKAADKISALIKCVEEKRMGNLDFLEAEKSTIEAIRRLDCKEADYFIDKFLDTYSLTLDEQA